MEPLFKRWCWVCACFLTFDVALADVSQTKELIHQEIEFYSQSSRGVLSACAVEFKGVDADFNYFWGSYGALRTANERSLVVLYKIGSAKIDETKQTKEYQRIKHIWIKSPSGSSLTEPWVGDRNDEENTFLLFGRNFTQGLRIFGDIALGGEVTIGYLHEGESIDRVYRLPTLPDEQRGAAIDCMEKLFLGN